MSRSVKYVLVLLLLIVTAGFAVDEVTKSTPSVLVVYSSGTPTPGFTDSILSIETLEAVSSATPVTSNTAQAARIIGETLQAEGVTVRIARAEEFAKTDWREVNEYQYIILGSPAHFSGMSWEMKKFLDEVFHMFYMSENKAHGKSFALFSVGGGMHGAESANADMEKTIEINDGKVLLRLGLSSAMNVEEFASKAADFARGLAVLIRK